MSGQGSISSGAGSLLGCGHVVGIRTRDVTGRIPEESEFWFCGGNVVRGETNSQHKQEMGRA